MKNIQFLILLLVALIGVSCESTYEKEYNWAYPVAGDWYVKSYINGEEYYGPFEIKSYNSAFGQDSIWIDDYGTSSYNETTHKYTFAGNFWVMKAKAAVDMNSKTFETAGSINGIAGYPITIKIQNGKVVNNDSIYFEIEFEDDPGTIYQIAGHREIGYEEYMGL